MLHSCGLIDEVYVRFLLVLDIIIDIRICFKGHAICFCRSLFIYILERRSWWAYVYPLLIVIVLLSHVCLLMLPLDRTLLIRRCCQFAHHLFLNHILSDNLVYTSFLWRRVLYRAIALLILYAFNSCHSSLLLWEWDLVGIINWWLLHSSFSYRG